MDEKDLNIYYLSLRDDTPCSDFWDYSIIYDLFAHIPGSQIYQQLRSIPDTEHAIVIIPARSHKNYVEKINEELSHIKGVVLFLMGDEESEFPVEKIKHDNIRIWVQNPRPVRHDSYRRIGTGYTPHTLTYIEDFPQKNLDYFFSGQITHSRRHGMVDALKNMTNGNGEIFKTEGFTKGLHPSQYIKKMARAKVALCPSGPETPDSFRLFEALEMGCVPIADTATQKGVWQGFWEFLFGEPVPFPVITDWNSLPSYIDEAVVQYPRLNNRIHAWWIRYKKRLVRDLINDLKSVGYEVKQSNITAVIPISPISSHPKTDILDETIASIKHQLPNIDIILTFDGVRQEQEGMRADYEEHIRRALWKYRSANVIPYIFDNHRHQVGMMREVIDFVDTPYILYMEHDTPLVTDYTIPFKNFVRHIEVGTSNLIRLHFEAGIPKEHAHLMIGAPENELQKTIQWSQRPHIASTAFYRRILTDYFTKNAKCFIEDLIHGKVIEDYQKYGIQGWYQWRLHIYHPDGNIKRSYNLDGRAGGIKFDESQIW